MRSMARATGPEQSVQANLRLQLHIEGPPVRNAAGECTEALGEDEAVAPIPVVTNLLNGCRSFRPVMSLRRFFRTPSWQKVR